MMNNFHYAISLAQTLYDVEGDIDDLEEIGLVAYDFIGNKNTQLIKDRFPVINGLVQLPCDIEIIESVTYNTEDWNYTTNHTDNGDLGSLYTETYIENTKFNKNPFYSNGTFVKYKKEGDMLLVDKQFPYVDILYQKSVLDKDGLPMLNDKEAIAIADYIAYTCKYKEALRTNNQNLFQIAKDIKHNWQFHCDAARVSEYINQNEMDAILNARSSWDRKQYNKSFKPIK